MTVILHSPTFSPFQRVVLNFQPWPSRSTAGERGHRVMTMDGGQCSQCQALRTPLTHSTGQTLSPHFPDGNCQKEQSLGQGSTAEKRTNGRAVSGDLVPKSVLQETCWLNDMARGHLSTYYTRDPSGTTSRLCMITGPRLSFPGCVHGPRIQAGIQ